MKMQQRLQELEPLADLLKVTYIQVPLWVAYVPRRPSILLSSTTVKGANAQTHLPLPSINSGPYPCQVAL